MYLLIISSGSLLPRLKVNVVIVRNTVNSVPKAAIVKSGKLLIEGR